jgi:IMP dehydrogenase
VVTKTGPDAHEYKVKVLRGMASFAVQDDHHGGVPEWRTAEGISIEVPYREDEAEIIADVVGGLRSGLTYGGAITIRELQRKLDYVRITSAGKRESQAHAALERP